MKRLNCILIAVALMVGGTAVGQINIPGGSIQKPPIPPAKQRTKPKKKAIPKKQAKYYDVTFTSNAYDGDLYIDGDYVGDANIKWTLKAGSHTVKVVTDYYNDYSTTINVSSSNKSFDLTLTEKTDAESQYQLGFNYYAGRSGFPWNQTLATEHFLNAANQGHADAQSWLGYCYIKGNGVTKNYTEAVKWSKKAAEKGDLWAMSALGYCYYYGLGVTKDYNEAAKWLKKVAEQGNATAQKNLGICYENGHGVTQSYAEAVNWYRKAAEQGDADAQYNLGYCYYYGNGVTQSYTEAVKWYRKAAEQGDADAQRNMGVCYEMGNGVNKDKQEAVKWYRKAAEQGNSNAKDDLKRLGY